MSAAASNPRKEYSLGYIPALDGLRAISILLVLAFHELGPTSAKVGQYFNGWIGVDVFFIVSGYLITLILLKEANAHNGAFSLRKFYIRRALRIAPAYYAFLLIAFLCLSVFDWKTLRAFLVAGVYLTDFDMALRWNLIPYPLGLYHLWSLAVEEQFYLLWPPVLRILKQRAILFCGVVIAAVYLWRMVLVSDGVHWIRLTAGFDTKIDAIMLGVIAAFLLSSPDIRKSAEKFFAPQWIQVGLVLLAGILFHALGHPKLGGMSEHLIFWGMKLPVTLGVITLTMVAIVMNPQGVIARILSTRIAVVIGRGSYSIYLWHVFTHHFFQSHWKIAAQNHPNIAEIGEFGLVFACAALSYFCIERPFLKLKAHFSSI